jgi:nicotinamide-nucleotide amidase
LKASLKSSETELTRRKNVLKKKVMRCSAIAEIIVVGNELLNGTTLDTNSHWLSKKLEEIGVTVSRKTTVRDDLESISSSFREALDRKPSWIFSVGGLGPTFDDMTLQGLALTIGKKIGLNFEALQYLKESYARRSNLKRRLTSSSLKMAMIPEGSTPLPNSVGSAPAVLTKYGSSKIVSFPGVPGEMKVIFRQVVLPLLQRDFPGLATRSQIWIGSKGVRESQIAPIIDTIMRKYASKVYVKSHPFGFDKQKNSLLHFQIISDETPNLYAQRAARTMERAIAKLGGKSQRLN